MLPTKFRLQPCLLTDRDEMSNLHRGPSIDDSYQLSVVAMFVNRSGRNEQSSQRTFHRCFLPSFGSFGQAVSEENIFLNRSIRKKNSLCRSYLLMYRDKMYNLQRGPYIDASYQVSVHLAEGFQRRRLKCEKLTDGGQGTADNGRQVMAKAHTAFGGHLMKKMTYISCINSNRFTLDLYFKRRRFSTKNSTWWPCFCKNQTKDFFYMTSQCSFPKD